jgi:hypothetical protein
MPSSASALIWANVEIGGATQTRMLTAAAPHASQELIVHAHIADDPLLANRKNAG